MERIGSALLTLAVFASANCAGQPTIMKEYGEWATMGSEDPADGWRYFVYSDGTHPVEPLASPYDNAVLSVGWTFDATNETLSMRVADAPRIGNLRKSEPPPSGNEENRSRSNERSRAPTRYLMERRVLVPVRWDEEPPTAVEGFLSSGGKTVNLFLDALAAAGVQDQESLAAFVADHTDHSTLLVEIPWADPQLSSSRFRIPLEGAAEAVEEAGRRYADLRGRGA